jgi:hypothetical protein
MFAPIHSRVSQPLLHRCSCELYQQQIRPSVRLVAPSFATAAHSQHAHARCPHTHAYPCARPFHQKVAQLEVFSKGQKFCSCSEQLPRW